MSAVELQACSGLPYTYMYMYILGDGRYVCVGLSKVVLIAVWCKGLSIMVAYV